MCPLKLPPFSKGVYLYLPTLCEVLYCMITYVYVNMAFSIHALWKFLLIPMKPNQTFISNCIKIKEWHGLQYVGKLGYLGIIADFDCCADFWHNVIVSSSCNFQGDRPKSNKRKDHALHSYREYGKNKIFNP